MQNANGGQKNPNRHPRRYRNGDLLPSELRLREFVAKQHLKTMKAALSVHAAADRGRKNKDWRAAPGSADLAIIPDAELLNARMRQLVRDAWPAKSIVRAYVRNIAGKGIQATPHAKAADGRPMVDVNKKAKAEFDHWARTKEVCDVEKKQTFYQKQALAVSERATVGEHFLVWSYDPPLKLDGSIDTSRPVGFRLQSFEPEQLDLRILSYSDPVTKESREVRGGIELDENGAAVAYHFYTRNPNDLLYRKSLWSKRVPRERVFHYYKQERVLQTRGVTPMTPVAADIREHSRFREATLWRAIMEACIGLIIRKPFPTPTGPSNSPLSFPLQSGDTGQTPGGMRTVDMVPGMVGELMPGEDVTTVTPTAPGNGFDPFVRATLQGIGAGAGMSMGEITRQSDGNYSSARQDMLRDRQEWEPEQQLLIDDIMRPVYCLWFDFAVLEGRFDGVKGFDAAEFLANRHQHHEVDFVPPPQTWIDPEKEANAFAILLKNRLITREEIIAMRGGRFMAVVNRLAAERDELDGLGLTVPEDAQDRTELRDLLTVYLTGKSEAAAANIANTTDNEEFLRITGVPQRQALQPVIPMPKPAAPAKAPAGGAPPKRLAAVALPILAPHYRHSDERVQTCQTCSFNVGGVCSKFNFDVDVTFVCDAWEVAPVAESPESGTRGFPPGPMPGEPGINRDFQSDAARQDVGII